MSHHQHVVLQLLVKHALPHVACAHPWGRRCLRSLLQDQRAAHSWPSCLHTLLLQELELANRYISTLDALLAGAPGSNFGRHLAASMAGAGSTERGSPSASAAATAAAAAAAAAASDPATAGSLGGLYGSLGLASAALEAQIKRTLDGQAARAEAVEVSSRGTCIRAALASWTCRLDVACTNHWWPHTERVHSTGWRPRGPSKPWAQR